MLPSALVTNPWVLLAAGLALAASHGAVGYKAYRLGQDNVYAEQAKLEEVEKRTREAALIATAEAISKIEVRNVTIRQKAETVVREVPVYRDCRHDPSGLQLVNEALTAPGSAGGGKLPGTDPAQRR